MTKKITWAILISLLALFLRVYLAVNGPFEYDETPYFQAAVQYNLAMRSGSWDQILNSDYMIEHPQFNKLVFAAGLLAFGPVKTIAPMPTGYPLTVVPYWPKLLGLRLISAFFGTVTVFVLSLIHPLAGLFLAVHTFEIKYTSVIYIEALPQLLCLLAMLGALKTLEIYRDGAGAARRSWLKWLLLSALAMGVTLASKYIYGAVMIAIGIAVLGRGWKQRGPVLLGLAGWGILCAAFFVLFDPVLWNGLVERLQASVQFNFNYSNSQFVSSYAYPVWQPVYWLLLSIPQHSTLTQPFFMNKADYFVMADSLIFILALVGLPALFKKNMPMFSWLLVGIAFLLLWRTKWPQYVLLVLPAFCLSAAYGFESVRAYLPGGKASLLDRLQRIKQVTNPKEN
jgi:hypothetical protein